MDMEKYDQIGAGYNSTRQADAYLTEMLINHLKPKPDGNYLDIGCGTGNYTIALASRGLNFTGVDPSEQMLASARQRSSEITWLRGNAESIPVDNGRFDGMIATLTIHHWKNLNKAFTEISRVLKENGKLVLFTSTPGQMRGYWLNHYFPKMLETSIAQMPDMARIKEAIRHTGLVMEGTQKYHVRPDLQDGFLYVGKNDPAMYFDEQIRNGISSFSSLANQQEVTQGLSELRKDIDGQTFDSIRKEYENDLGDYIFLILRKSANL